MAFNAILILVKTQNGKIGMDFQLFYYVEKNVWLNFFLIMLTWTKMLNVFNAMTDHTKLMLIGFNESLHMLLIKWYFFESKACTMYGYSKI